MRSSSAQTLPIHFAAALVATAWLGACGATGSDSGGTGTTTATGHGGTSTTTALGGGGAGAGTTTSSGGNGTGGGGASGGSGGSGTPCPVDMVCPDSFPFHHQGDTSQSNRRELDGYACAPSTDESGPEVVYRLSLSEPGFLSAAVTDDTASGIDIDVHILSELDAGSCLDRGNHHARAHVPAGTYYVVADTFVSGGDEQTGAYAIDIGFIVPPAGSCAMTTDVVNRIGGPSVTLPATGAMVLEAHLVTLDDGFGASWPGAIGDGIPHHYDVSFAATDFVMARSQPWAPQESSEFGQSAYTAKLPVLDEGWYINMMWASRPAPGTRMILQRPGSSAAVVAAAGYETGPGNTDHLGGTTEEVHFYLDTGHLDDMRIGFAADQTLPLGPIACTP